MFDTLNEEKDEDSEYDELSQDSDSSLEFDTLNDLQNQCRSECNGETSYMAPTDTDYDQKNMFSHIKIVKQLSLGIPIPHERATDIEMKGPKIFLSLGQLKQEEMIVLQNVFVMMHVLLQQTHIIEISNQMTQI